MIIYLVAKGIGDKVEEKLIKFLFKPNLLYKFQ